MEHSPVPVSLEDLLAQSACGMRRDDHPEPRSQCCCGKPSCAFLVKNDAALDGLERDLQSAAQIGQALLVRHEAHMAEAEAERLRMTSTIERLEMNKKELEASNAKTIAENRDLLDQLEDLNNTILDSDIHIQSLTATLETTRRELQRLTVLAGRTSQLEAQLALLESEQATLQAQLTTSEEKTRSNIQRWKRAEGTIGYLQDQIDRIEKEANEERERHVEVYGRLERQRTVEKELESAAGRLKGAAAITTLGRHQAGSNVVSHFVKDILQDNVNLQMGIVELREMLMGSNAEVESLREQLFTHQPIEDGEVEENVTLKAELEREATYDPLPELHVHHHYHGPEKPARKPKKRRALIAQSHFAPSSGYSTPARTQRIRDWHATPPSSVAAILSNTSVTVPPSLKTHSNRWSIHSSQTGGSFAASSVPSSPRSLHRSSSIFDNVDVVFDSSRPTTPGSSNPGSPLVIAQDRSILGCSQRSISIPLPLHLKSMDSPVGSSGGFGASGIEDDITDSANVTVRHRRTSSRPRLQNVESLMPKTFGTHRRSESFSESISESGGTVTPIGHATILEEPEYSIEPSSSEPSYLQDLSQPKLRRAASHESLLSISGMDIHTLCDRPSQMYSAHEFTSRNLHSLYSPTSTAFTASQAVISPTTAAGRAAFPRSRVDSSEYTRSLLSQNSNAEGKSTLGKRVGGWVWSGWGVTPMASTGNLRSTAVSSVPASPMFEAWSRSPGVNQSGPIRGLKPPIKSPCIVQPVVVDTALLQESLEGV